VQWTIKKLAIPGHFYRIFNFIKASPNPVADLGPVLDVAGKIKPREQIIHASPLFS